MGGTWKEERKRERGAESGMRGDRIEAQTTKRINRPMERYGV